LKESFRGAPPQDFQDSGQQHRRSRRAAGDCSRRPANRRALCSFRMMGDTQIECRDANSTEGRGLQPG